MIKTILGSIIGGIVALVSAYSRGKSTAKKDFNLKNIKEDNEIMLEEIKKHEENAKINKEIERSLIDKSPRGILKQLRKAKAKANSIN